LNENFEQNRAAGFSLRDLGVSAESRIGVLLDALNHYGEAAPLAESKHPLTNRYPELEHFDSRAEARAAMTACRAMQIRTPWFWLALIGYTLGVGLVMALSLLFVRRYLPLSGAVYGGVVGGITGGTGVLFLQWFWRNRFRKLLRQRLIAAGVPICIQCGYDLRGQTEPRCPECGKAFDEVLKGSTQ
jgi:hypothetical protein